jgi:branched-chain amino acid transport system permease protein
MVFGVMRIVNIAHGSFSMLGAYIAWRVAARTHSLLVAAVAACAAVTIVGLAVERLFLRRLASRPLAQMT